MKGDWGRDFLSHNPKHNSLRPDKKEECKEGNLVGPFFNPPSLQQKCSEIVNNNNNNNNNNNKVYYSAFIQIDPIINQLNFTLGITQHIPRARMEAEKK